jgi:hypothetical protein
MAVWTLQIGEGEAATLPALGVVQAIETRASQALDTVQITFREQVEGDVIPERTRGILRRDGEPWFVGHFIRPRAMAAPQTEGKTYLLAGGRFWMEQHQYRQPWKLPAPDPGFAKLPRYIWFVRGSLVGNDFDQVPVSTEVDDLVSQLVADGAPIRAAASYSSLNIQPLPQKGESLRSGQALQVLLAWVPDAADWWDYTTTNGSGDPRPTYYAKRFAGLETVTLALGDLVAVELESLAGLQPEYLRMVIHTQREKPDGLTGSFYKSAFQEILVGTRPTVGGVTNAPFFGVEVVVDEHRTANGVMVQEESLEPLAVAFWQATRASGWTGTVTYKGRDGEPHATLRPGMKLRITGGRTEWATMDALVQGVVHNILEGTTQVRLGATRGFTLEQLRELMTQVKRWLRFPTDNELKEKATRESSSTNVGGGDERPDDERDPDNKNCCCDRDDYYGGMGGGS